MTTSYTFWPELPLDSPVFQAVAELLAKVLESPAAEAEADLRYQQARQPVQAWLAMADNQIVGCKIGYERKPGHYYSWLGGVHPAFRGRGLAAELLRQQHAWCAEHDYHHIRTHTYNRWRAMLLLNLRHGFDIVGTLQGPHGLIIMLEKSPGIDDAASTKSLSNGL